MIIHHWEIWGEGSILWREMFDLFLEIVQQVPLYFIESARDKAEVFVYPDSRAQ
jgi:hypothetical protein